ncbi:hypothetical protein LENED_012871 [Lentinula edodes]|uniref:Uncharacterized protein n=1 Tax=Lentinula edodes TaxID=5353 RepID=A0A1Q3ETS7_LENED|nr:hypothetical protein LENED_012871 [Lentinula edodes]
MIWIEPKKSLIWIIELDCFRTSSFMFGLPAVVRILRNSSCGDHPFNLLLQLAKILYPEYVVAKSLNETPSMVRWSNAIVCRWSVAFEDEHVAKSS